MPAETVNIDDVDVQMGAMKRLRGALDTQAVGLTVVDCDPGWEGPEHDHAEADHEEVYLLVEGAASVAVDGQTVDLEPGDAIRVDPEETRQIHNGDTRSRLVLAGANRMSDI
jgi:mannose-6-phosphate isomerase-like protein (cupin superfamily)